MRSDHPARVVIAGALVLEPDLLVADEPVSMLDVSIRAERDITILYTTPDLATAGYFTDRMAVMYLGRIVELGPTIEVLGEPRHPYTRALISVVPVPNPRRRHKRTILEGEIPDPIDIPTGCRFHMVSRRHPRVPGDRPATPHRRARPRGGVHPCLRRGPRRKRAPHDAGQRRSQVQSQCMGQAG